MSSEQVRVDHNDAEFAGVMAKARDLFAVALAIGHSEAGSEKPQAVHFCMTAILNAAGMDEEQAVGALAAIVGTACAEFEQPDLARHIIHQMSADFLEDALSRERIGPRQ